MGKWAQYGKQYNKNWEKDDALKDWIHSVPGDNSKAFCRYCKCDIHAYHTNLLSHASTVKHKRNSAPFSSTRTLYDVDCHSKNVDHTVKIAELKLAAHVACHSSTPTIDHLGEVIKDISGKDIALHRMKCSALIKHVLGPAVHEELISDLDKNETVYSLIIDESTDIGPEKQLCVMVRYYSRSLKSITTTFLGIISLDSVTANEIFNTITKFLAANRLAIDRCLGLATDGCSTMYGKINFVIARFREVCPDIVHIKCICHSIQLSSSRALMVMPSNVEFMIAETYNWFYHSSIRQQKYKQLYECIDVGEEPMKILKLSDTRWLSIATCVQRVLEHYEELKLHFQIVKKEACSYTAELLYQMFSTPENKLYLVFLRPILQELSQVNKLFESDKASPVQLVTELLTLYCNMLQRILRPTTFTSWGATLAYNLENGSNYLPLAAINFGIEFQLSLHESQIERSSAEQIKEHCRDYLLELLKEIRQRLPDNIQQLESLVDLSPSVVLGAQKPQLLKLSFLPLYKGNLGDLEQQWMRISTLSWPTFSDNDIEQFWVTVVNHIDASGNHDFLQLGHFALCMLALPFSNAAVERTFSQMNLIKLKLRNKLRRGTLEALLHIRSYMRRRGICCREFTPTTKMLSKFNAVIYASDDDSIPEEYFTSS
ncbi:uncharacterized protein LOC115459228 [Microcaecilia unicolor]|uniref:Uncharacterized protein LOC115459228 n=1 Tax=Microcaecilia unicolor TaxID=1415580 RepID=A0A6P7WXB7_9AMPH|nr:uncharacterized protein LOC115459228 [Microcaecilia unicolor]XP_030044943.1 uncharacterized protein LOC115459228 [Microcaecilia unicolor]XP_030044944.1 uncharacterized protein LOC115459228 [Microcaecilia unicolor]